MKLMTYNILFGMKGDSALDAFLSNLSIHGLRPILPFGTLPNRLRGVFVKRRSKYLEDVVDLIGQERPDILCLNEVLKGLHQERLEKALRYLGYGSIFWGVSKHHRHPYDIATVLAIKFPSEQIDIDIPLLAKPGGGGGHCAAFIPGKNLSVAAVHPSIWKRVRNSQIRAMKAFADREMQKGRKVALMGDFNAGESEIKEIFNGLSLNGYGREMTHPSFKFPVHLRKPQVLDYCLIDSSFHTTSSKVLNGNSDHRGVVLEIAQRKNP